VKKTCIVWIPLIALSGCATSTDLPLIFGQSHTVGLTIGASTADQGAELTLGYKDRNIAIIPVVARDKENSVKEIRAKIPQWEGEHGVWEDSLSVFGQFELHTGTTTETGSTGAPRPTVGLGKFFATGQAATTLAKGFAAKLGARDSEGETVQQPAGKPAKPQKPGPQKPQPQPPSQ